MKIGRKRSNSRRLPSSKSGVNISKYLPKKLIPLPLHKNKVRYLKNEKKLLDKSPQLAKSAFGGGSARVRSQQMFPKIDSKTKFIHFLGLIKSNRFWSTAKNKKYFELPAPLD